MIRFHYLKPVDSLKDRARLKRFLKSLFRIEKKKLAGLDIIFCSDNYLLKINEEYLKHNYFTDIITFPLSLPGGPISAEIYISVDRVRENAVEFNSSFIRELHRVVFHGVLHLCGYGDKTKAQVAAMRKLEDTCLTRYFLK